MEELKSVASGNKVMRSFIGMGYGMPWINRLV